MKTIAAVLACALCSACGGSMVDTVPVVQATQSTPATPPPTTPTPAPTPAPSPPPPTTTGSGGSSSSGSSGTGSAGAGPTFQVIALGVDQATGLQVGGFSTYLDQSGLTVSRQSKTLAVGQINVGTGKLLGLNDEAAYETLPDGTVIDLGFNGTANALNNQGGIVGRQEVNNSSIAFMYNIPTKTLTQVTGLGAPGEFATGINDSGEIVGTSIYQEPNAIAQGNIHAWLNIAGKVYDLNQYLTAAQQSAFQLTSAEGINCQGSIIAYSQDGDGFPHGAFLLVRTDIQRTCTP